jgi:all-trans-retinol 13,14-reductase
VSASWDAIVIGSGIGGLACAAALARMRRRVLVLERHDVAGGLTQTFSRDGYTWDVGVHYLGDMAPGRPARRVLDWLSGGTIEMAPLGAVYDTVRFPGDFEFQYARPEAALRAGLKEKFPASEREIDAFLEAIAAAERAAMAMFAARSMPGTLGEVFGWLQGSKLRRWWGRTTAEVLGELIGDPRLRSVLAAAWGDHGGRPAEGSFGMQAVVMRHYLNGAWYPFGGASVFARALGKAIAAAGGEVRTSSVVTEIVLKDVAAAGVRLAGGETIAAPRVISDAGAHNTVARLLPAAARESAWGREILGLEPSLCHLQLYLGLEGDIRSRGASTSNYWFYDTWDVGDAAWSDPFEQAAPRLVFVSFPSLKNPSPGKHTAEVVAFTGWDVFSEWRDSDHGARPPAYQGFKTLIEERLLAQFERRFPALAPLVRWREVSTPLTTAAFTGAWRGGSYGLEPTPRRFLSRNLGVRTPIRGLYLAGQDAATTGVTGAMMGGVLAAAALEPRVLAQLRWKPHFPLLTAS